MVATTNISLTVNVESLVGEARAKEENDGSGDGGGDGSGQIANAHYLCELYPFSREVLQTCRHTETSIYDR